MVFIIKVLSAALTYLPTGIFRSRPLPLQFCSLFARGIKSPQNHKIGNPASFSKVSLYFCLTPSIYGAFPNNPPLSMIIVHARRFCLQFDRLIKSPHSQGNHLLSSFLIKHRLIN